jgi:hypothetical protein
MQKAAACMLLPSLQRARSNRWKVSISRLTYRHTAASRHSKHPVQTRSPVCCSQQGSA